MTDLAPCPGCGRNLGTNDHVIGGSRESSRVYYRQSCPCGWWGPEAETLDGARAQWNHRALALRWRREPPDVPGWWWHRHAGMHSHWRCTYYDARECVDMREYADPRVEWAGPIPEPEEGE